MTFETAIAIAVISTLDDADRAQFEEIVGTADAVVSGFLTGAMVEVDLRKGGTFPQIEPEQSSAIHLAALSEGLSRLALAWRPRVSRELADVLVQIMLAAQAALSQALHKRGDTEASEN